jgi:hypothetical protein
VTWAAGGFATATALLLFPRPPAAESPVVMAAPTAGEAIARVLEAPAPIVLGVGELHQTNATAGTLSSLARFTRDLWPLLASRTSDLIVETWVTDGACGRAERATIEKVERTTLRPAATESEIVTLLKRAKASGARPHILTVGCDEYRLLSPGGDARPLDFQRMLALIQRKLAAQITEVLWSRPARDADKLLVVYGGALHNDLHPDPLLASFSYGVPAYGATLARYRELDLYVPEYLERTPAMQKEAWFPLWRSAGQAGRMVLIRRSPASFVLVFPPSRQAR